MGLCASSPVSSEINENHQVGIFHENAICCVAEGKVLSANGSQGSAGSVYSRTGAKGLNQDSGILHQEYGMEGGAFCGVFDGHGKNGHLISNAVRNQLPSLVLNQRNVLASVKPQHKEFDGIVSGASERSGTWSEACLSAFKAMDKEFKLQENVDYSTSGTTAVVVIRQNDELVVANLGDSRAVLGRVNEDGKLSVIQLSTDLKPNVSSEADRIRKCNGRVLALKDEPHIQRVWLPNEDMPGLAMSRAFGDFLLKNHGIIAIPDVSYHRISPEDEFIVLATDGVWDVMTNDEVAKAVRSAMEAQNSAAKAVVDAAVAAWKKKYPSSKIDDCTVVCLSLQQTQHTDTFLT